MRARGRRCPGHCELGLTNVGGESPVGSARQLFGTLGVRSELSLDAVATVVGVPLANWLGQSVGWRFAFGIVAALALTCTVLVFLFVPSDGVNPNASPLRELEAIADLADARDWRGGIRRDVRGLHVSRLDAHPMAASHYATVALDVRHRPRRSAGHGAANAPDGRRGGLPSACSGAQSFRVQHRERARAMAWWPDDCSRFRARLSP
jgi:hypothetical protein